MNVLREELQPYFDIPFAFFGHSMGALIAFELARKLRRSRGPMPVRLFLSGRRAPHLPPARRPIHHLPDAEFRQEVRLLQGTPEEVLSNEELMQIVLPVLRADFAVCETYVYSAEEPLDVPLSVFGSNNDPEVNRSELEAWRSQTTSSMSLRIFEGNHFFLHPMRSALTDAIAHDISRCLALILRVFVVSRKRIPAEHEETRRREVPLGGTVLHGLRFSRFGYQQDDNTGQRSEYDRTDRPPPETDGAISAEIAYAQGQYDIC